MIMTGIIPIKTMVSAPNEAWPYISSEANKYTLVDKVSKLKGLNKSVIGNSLTQSTNTSRKEVISAPLIRESEIFHYI